MLGNVFPVGDQTQTETIMTRIFTSFCSHRTHGRRRITRPVTISQQMPWSCTRATTFSTDTRTSAGIKRHDTLRYVMICFTVLCTEKEKHVAPLCMQTTFCTAKKRLVGNKSYRPCLLLVRA